MATGRRPFDRGTRPDTIDCIIRAEPEPIHNVNPNVPEPLCWIIERCLAKDRSGRYDSTHDLAQELHTLRDRLSAGAITSLRSPATSRRRFAAIAGVVATIVLAVFLATRPQFFGEPPLPGPQYLGVLPFTDTSGSRSSPMFSQGFADTVSARLAKFSIQVVPPSASSKLVGAGADVRRISRELGATLLLNGSMQRAGRRVRVTWSLIDAAKGVVVAGDVIEGTVDDIWSIQDQLARAVAERMGFDDEVPPTIAGQAELETSTEQVLYLSAMGNLQEQDNQAAVESSLTLLRELLETASDSALVHAALARAYLAKYTLTRDREWIARATAAAERARTLAPSSPDVLLALGTAQRLSGKFDEAIQSYSRAAALQPQSAEIVIGLAKTYQRAGKPEEAEKTFRRGIELNPRWWSAYNELGAFYVTRNRYDEALAEFSRAIELNGDGAWAYANAGAAHMGKERFQEAIALLTKAVALRPDNIAAYSNLAYCYYYLGQYDKSAESARKATVLQPRQASGWLNLADACRWSSQCAADADLATKTAAELLRNDLAVNPKNARAHGELAVVLARIGERAEAARHIEEALRLDPANSTRMYQAARVANLTGDVPAAVAWLRRAVDAGHSRFEIERDPDFRALRASQSFRTTFEKSAQS